MEIKKNRKLEKTTDYERLKKIKFPAMRVGDHLKDVGGNGKETEPVQMKGTDKLIFCTEREKNNIFSFKYPCLSPKT